MALAALVLGQVVPVEEQWRLEWMERLDQGNSDAGGVCQGPTRLFCRLGMWSALECMGHKPLLQEGSTPQEGGV